MKNKIGYWIIAIAIACGTIFYSSFMLPIQAQEVNVETSSARRNVTQSFVYIITNPDGPNAVAAYARNPKTGKLKFIASYPTGGDGSNFVLGVSEDSLVTDGSYLYAVNAGSNNISTLAIQRNGALQLVGSPVSSGGLSPVSLAVRKGLLYVANQGDADTPANLTGFTIENGSLTPLNDSTVQLNFNDAPGDILFNKAGNILIGTRVGGSIIDSYQVNSNGRLSRVTRLVRQPGAFGAAFSPVADQQLLVTFGAGATNMSYLVSDEGQISPISTAIEAEAGDPCWVVFSQDGTYAWIDSFLTNILSLYKVDANGALNFVSRDNTTDVGLFSADIALSSDDKYLYQSKPLPLRPIISVLRVSRLTDNPRNAGLEKVETVDLPSGSNPIGLVTVDVKE